MKTASNHQQHSTDKRQHQIKGFYAHLISAVVSTALIFVINFMTSSAYLWAVWVFVGWGFGVLVHGLVVFMENGSLSLKQSTSEVEVNR